MKVASSEIIIAHLTLLTRSKTLNSERVNNIDKILKKVISQQGLPLVIVLFDIEFFSYDHSLSLSLSLSCAQRREEQKKQIHEMAYYDPAPSVWFHSNKNTPGYLCIYKVCYEMEKSPWSQTIVIVAKQIVPVTIQIH